MWSYKLGFNIYICYSLYTFVFIFVNRLFESWDCSIKRRIYIYIILLKKPRELQNMQKKNNNIELNYLAIFKLFQIIRRRTLSI